MCEDGALYTAVAMLSLLSSAVLYVDNDMSMLPLRKNTQTLSVYIQFNPLISLYIYCPKLRSIGSSFEHIECSFFVWVVGKVDIIFVFRG